MNQAQRLRIFYQSQRLRIFWWLALGAFFVGVVSGSRWALAVGALVAATFALAMAVNYRGLGNAFPTRAPLDPFRVKWSPVLVRATFGLFAIILGFLFVVATIRLT